MVSAPPDHSAHRMSLWSGDARVLWPVWDWRSGGDATVLERKISASPSFIFRALRIINIPCPSEDALPSTRSYQRLTKYYTFCLNRWVRIPILENGFIMGFFILSYTNSKTKSPWCSQCGILGSNLWCRYFIWIPAWLLTALLPTQLLANVPEKAAEDGPGAWALAPTLGDPQMLLTPGFREAQLWPMWISGEWIGGWKISLCLSL